MSFQTRYWLPLMPLLAGWAAVALVEATPKWRRRLGIAACAWALLFAFLVAKLQQGGFGDLREACRQAAAQLAPDATLYTNETPYGGISAPKVVFWTGHAAQYLGTAGQLPDTLKTGDVIVFSEAYGDMQPVANELLARFQVESTVYQRRIVPLLPDIMVQPRTTSQPAAMGYRYTEQIARTWVLQLR